MLFFFIFIHIFIELHIIFRFATWEVWWWIRVSFIENKLILCEGSKIGKNLIHLIKLFFHNFKLCIHCFWNEVKVECVWIWNAILEHWFLCVELSLSLPPISKHSITVSSVTLIVSGCSVPFLLLPLPLSCPLSLLFLNSLLFLYPFLLFFLLLFLLFNFKQQFFFLFSKSLSLFLYCFDFHFLIIKIVLWISGFSFIFLLFFFTPDILLFWSTSVIMSFRNINFFLFRLTLFVVLIISLEDHTSVDFLFLNLTLLFLFYSRIFY